MVGKQSANNRVCNMNINRLIQILNGDNKTNENGNQDDEINDYGLDSGYTWWPHGSTHML